MKQWTLGLVFVLALGNYLVADDQQDTAAIRQRVQSYVEAFNRGDATAVAAHWSAGAVYIAPATGERIQGREAIERAFAEWFAGDPRVQLNVSVESIRLITPEVAIEDGRGQIVSSAEPPSESTYTAVHVRQDGQWYLDSVRETVLPSAPSHFGRLQSLSWLVGEWVDRDENATVVTKCEWTKNKNFITRSFSVLVADQIELEGTQVIGWDPAAETIRSWMFDTDGGFAEATWTKENDRWTIQSRQVLPDGSLASSINVLTRIDDNSFTWQSVNREVDGESLANIEPVTVVRK